MAAKPPFARSWPPRSVLIVRLSALGDVIHALPALDALRRAFPAARIGWLVEEKCASLLDGHPQVDRLHVLPRHRAAAAARRSPLGALVTLAAFFRDLRRERYEVAIDLQGNLRSGLATRLAGAPVRVGFARGHCKEGNFLLTNLHVSPPRTRLHKVAKDLLLVSALGVETAGARPQVAVPAAARDRASAFVRGLGPGGPLVALHPGTSRWAAFKQWSAEGYAEVADRLAAASARVLVTWGPGERDLAERIAALARTRPALAPETRSVLDLAALFERCAAVVGCDTGPTHLAAALGRPAVGLYGMKDPAVYGISGPGPIEIVYKGVPCSPCNLRFCPDTVCMEAIRPDDVVSAIGRLLAGNGSSGSGQVVAEVAGQVLHGPG